MRPPTEAAARRVRQAALLGTACLAFALARWVPAQILAPSAEGGEGDVLTAHDGRGGLAAVYNQFDGRDHSIRINRLGFNGGVLWSVEHSDGNWERANAAAMDANGYLYVAGTRRSRDGRRFLLMRFTPEGSLAWEVEDNWTSCEAVAVAADAEGYATMAGGCRSGDSFPARVVKYHPEGGLMWGQSYDRGGRNYVRGLQPAPGGEAWVTVETVYGSYGDGSYRTQVLAFDAGGQLVGTR